MAVLSVLSHIAAATLLVSGVAKLRAPDSTRPLLEIAAERIAAEAPSLRPWIRHRALGRLLGGAELLLGGGTLMGSRVAALCAAVSYVLFAELLMAARARGVESCGCFGDATTPPTLGHVVANLTAAVAVFVAALATSMPAAWAVVAGRPLLDAAYLVVVGVATALVVTSGSVGAEVSRRRHLLATEPPAARRAGAAS